VDQTFGGFFTPARWRHLPLRGRGLITSTS
jgi:hypothetical protein